MLILGKNIPLKDNLNASLRLYWYLWLILVITVFLDFVTTVLFMWNDGIHTEMNFIVRWLASTIGILPGVLLGKLLQIISAIGFSSLSLSFAGVTLLLIILLNLMAVVINL